MGNSATVDCRPCRRQELADNVRRIKGRIFQKFCDGRRRNRKTAMRHLYHPAADVKRRVAAGELTAADVVMDCPWQAQSMSISDLLMSQKRWGRTRCRRLLMSLSVPENKQVGTLTDRQRIALAAVLTQKNAPAGDDDASATSMEARVLTAA